MHTLFHMTTYLIAYEHVQKIARDFHLATIRHGHDHFDDDTIQLGVNALCHLDAQSQSSSMGMICAILGEDRTVALFIKLLEDVDAILRAMAVRAFQWTGQASNYSDAVSKMLGDPSETVRLEALKACGTLECEQALKLLTDDCSEVRASAADKVHKDSTGEVLVSLAALDDQAVFR